HPVFLSSLPKENARAGRKLHANRSGRHRASLDQAAIRLLKLDLPADPAALCRNAERARCFRRFDMEALPVQVNRIGNRDTLHFIRSAVRIITGAERADQHVARLRGPGNLVFEHTAGKIALGGQSFAVLADRLDPRKAAARLRVRLYAKTMYFA